MWRAGSNRGFTIVELLIVVIVIAILAAIVIVAYNGMQRRALDSAIQADLKQAVTKVELSKVENGKYPTNLAAINITDMDLNGGKVVFNYSANAPDYTQYCISARAFGRTFYATQGRLTPEPGYCDGTTAVPNDGTVVITSCKFTGITLATNETQTLSCLVPEGADWLAISEFITTSGGGSGNGSYVYVKRGSAPTTSDYDCRATASAIYVSQQCIFDAPESGEYHILLRQVYGSLANGELEVIWGSYGSGTVAYTAPYVTVSGGRFSRQSHSYEVPAGVDYLVVSALGTTTHAGMFGPSLAVKYGGRPGLGSTDAGATANCNQYTGTYPTDQCIIMNPTPGTWYIETYAYRGSNGTAPSAMGRNQSYVNYQVEAITGTFSHTTHDYTGPVQLSGGAFARESYKIAVPAGASSLTVTTSGGDSPLYGVALAVKQGSRPGVGSADPSAGAQCQRMASNDNNNTCTITSPVAGDYYIEVYSFYGFGGSAEFGQGRNQWFSNTTLTATIN